MPTRAPGARALEVPEERRDEWNALVAAQPYFALFQAWEWERARRRFGFDAVRVAVEERGRLVAGAQLLLRRLPLGLRIGYAPRGPVGRWLEPGIAPLLFPALHRAARRRRALLTRIEPALAESPEARAALHRLGFRPCGDVNVPRATLVVDLAPEPDRILASMHRKTRYNIRLAERRGVEVRVGGRDDLVGFHGLLAETARRGEFPLPPLGYYTDQWDAFAGQDVLRLLIASHAGRDLAAFVAAAFGRHAVYLYGAWSGERGDLMPNHLLMWESIRWARERGCVDFDLWGIPTRVGEIHAERGELPVVERTNVLWGAYRFKRGFSEDLVFRVPAHDRAYVPGIAALTSGDRTWRIRAALHAWLRRGAAKT